MIKKIVFTTMILFTCGISLSQNTDILKENKWSTEKAADWYSAHDWISGADFIPSTAINQLEMWQKETFDPETIDRELGYAEGIGMNTMRVYLHSLAYKEDPN